jgi:hypothetical protein
MFSEFLKIRFVFTEVLLRKLRVKLDFLGLKRNMGGGKRNFLILSPKDPMSSPMLESELRNPKSNHNA